MFVVDVFFSGGNYAMPHPSRLKYTQMFNSNDRNKKGTLTGKHSHNQKLRSMSGDKNFHLSARNYE